MKKVLFSALAASIAIAGVVSANKVSANSHFTSNTFKFILPLSSGTPTLHQLTTTSNWATFTAGVSNCSGSSYICKVVPLTGDNIVTTAQLAAKIRTSAGIPGTYNTAVKQVYQ